MTAKLRWNRLILQLEYRPYNMRSCRFPLFFFVDCNSAYDCSHSNLSSARQQTAVNCTVDKYYLDCKITKSCRISFACCFTFIMKKLSVFWVLFVVMCRSIVHCRTFWDHWLIFSWCFQLAIYVTVLCHSHGTCLHIFITAIELPNLP